MDADHHIEWIEVVEDARISRLHLKPGKAPLATFPCSRNQIRARAYCNQHGLWRAEA
jgi:superoxide reductase